VWKRDKCSKEGEGKQKAAQLRGGCVVRALERRGKGVNADARGGRGGKKREIFERAAVAVRTPITPRSRKKKQGTLPVAEILQGERSVLGGAEGGQEKGVASLR